MPLGRLRANWEGGAGALIREPGDLPMTVVPRRAGCTGLQRDVRDFVRASLAMNGIRS